MSVDSNALNTNSLKPSKSTKVLNSARYAEKEKHLDVVADKKTADNCHHSERVKPAKKIMLYTSSNNQSRQAVSRQKHRAPSNQPVWRPGGAAKIPTFNNVTTLVQKTRPATHNREKTNLENAREEKHGRTVSEFKKKPSTEIYSCKDVPKLNVDNSKIASKRSDASLNISPRSKPRSRISRPVSKNFNESEKPFTCVKNYARRSVCDMIHERVTTESKVLRALEEIIRTTSENNEGENVGNVTHRTFRNQLPNETCSADLRKTSESIVVEEEMKVNEEEPTRDIDSERYKKSQLNKRSQGDLSENILKTGEYSLVSIVPKSLTPVLRAGVGKDTKNVGTSGNFGHIPSEVERNISLETAASCRILDFNTTSVETDEIEAWKSDAVSNQKCKDKKFNENDISKENSSFTDDNEKQQKYHDTEPKTSNNLSIVKIEKARVNSHAISLSMLKEFLYDQGVDVDLVNKAERYLKGKQKARKGLRKKSISFADVSSYVEHDRHFGKRMVLRKEHSWEEELENEIKKDDRKCIKKDIEGNIEKNVEIKKDDRKCIKKYIEGNIEKDTEKNVEKNIEKDAGNDMKTDVERFKVLSEREISSPRMRDVTTCTIKDSNNACTQTVFHCRTSKGLQTIFKNDSLTTEETQTEVERRNACTMTESLRVRDDSVETPKICCSCKSVITERLDEFQNEESKFRKTRQDSGNSRSRGDPRRNISTDVERREKISENEFENEDSKLKIRKEYPKGSESRKDFHEEVLRCSKKIDKTSSRQCSLVYQKLFHQMQEEHEKSNALLTSVDSSTTHSLSSKSSKDHNLHFNENGTKEEPKDEDRSPVRIVSSGIVAALQVAAIRARNVYRAFDIHKRILRSDLKKLRKQSRQRKKLDKVLGTREEERAKTVSKSDVVLNFKKQVVQRGNDSKKTVVEVFKNLRRAEVASKEFLGEMLSDSRSESEDNLEKNLDFVNTVSTNASSSQISFKSIDLEIPKRSSSSVILRNVRSLMEFLVSQADDATFERIERRVEKQSNTREAKFSGNVRMEIVKMNRRFSFFSKENLLLLVYGMLCSVVFWCLNFTITCDVVL
ncbi:unnamed protein product, partial [Heterotrigona itama]